MFCTNCGKENPNGQKFCSECGAQINQQQAAAAYTTNTTGANTDTNISIATPTTTAEQNKSMANSINRAEWIFNPQLCGKRRTYSCSK